MSIKDKINDLINPEDNYHVKNTLSSYSDYDVIRMNICRKPVMKILLQILALLDKGFRDFTKNGPYYYDQIFHLYAVFECRNPETNDMVYIRTEKDPRVIFKISDSLDLDTEDHLNIDFYKMTKDNIKLGELILKTKENMGKNFDEYNPVSNNCQFYILELVNSFFQLINFPSGSQAYKRYIFTDVSKALKKNSFTGKLATKITDIGRIFNKLIGKGKETGVDYSLSDGDIKKFFKNKIKIIKYSDLDDIKLEDLFDKYNKCIILYELEDINNGHWTLLKFDDKNKTVQYFDSFGLFPESELRYMNPKLIEINRPSKLLKILDEQPYRIEYNDHKLQDFKTSTCGKWCCIFGKSNMSIDEFANYIKKNAELNNLTNDEYISKIYDSIT